MKLESLMNKEFKIWFEKEGKIYQFGEEDRQMFLLSWRKAWRKCEAEYQRLSKDMIKAVEIIKAMIQVLPTEDGDYCYTCPLEKCVHESIRCCDCEHSITPSGVVENAEDFLSEFTPRVVEQKEGK
jgi:hypothetical protein